MAKVGLNDICAKLSRNAEMTSKDVDSCSLSHSDDDKSSVSITVDRVDEQHRAAAAAGPASLPPSELVDVATHESMTLVGIDGDADTLKPGDRASLMDSGYGEDGDSMDDGGVAGTGRRSRRKNFLPRCVQDRLVIVERDSEPRQTADTAAAPTTTWSKDVEDELSVLDLRTCRDLSTPTRQTGDFSAICLKKSIYDKHDQVLDLSISRCDRGAPDSGVARDTRTTGWRTDKSSTGDELNSVDMRVYAANTMTELLNIYGLPDESQSAVTDLRKWVPPADNSSDTLRGVDLRPVQLGVNAAAASKILDRDHQQIATTLLSSRHVPDYIFARPPELTHEKVGQKKRHFENNSSPAMLNSDKVKQAAGGIMILDYNQYVSQYLSVNSSAGCCSSLYQVRDHKEHFHCTACVPQVCMKKEDIIRHFKWHKKRSDSLQHGFMRFSPLEDCSQKFHQASCIHNGKHTHYHCLQDGCSKVYISTSDVQMHANYHRKDSAIIQEGFQRFRATENCSTPSCVFVHQKTTHFHCRRPGCCFTFKNKSDMEKHKVYHQKDEALTRDGFKKFMKYEQCQFDGCIYSHLSNHIHCIRPGCNYVLHSSGQLFSHKRKHERRLWEYTAPCKQPKLVSASSIATSSEGSAPIPGDVAAAVSSSVAVATISLHDVTVQPKEAPPAVTICQPMDSVMCAATTLLQGAPCSATQSSMSQPTAVAASTSLNVPVNDPATSSLSTEAGTQHADDKGEPTIQNVKATIVDASQFQMDTNSDKLSGIRPSPEVIAADDDDCVFVSRSSPSRTSPPTIVIEQTFSLATATDPDVLKLEKLEKKEFVDLEDLAKMTKYKQIAEEKNTGLESQQSTQGAVNDVALCSTSNTLLAQDATAANSTSATSSMLLVMPSNSVPSTKSSRPGSERRERDDSWQNYIKRYTANDACFPRCELMYKDHYHCMEADCGALFRSKEGVRDHAKMHEQQERVTSMTYSVYTSDEKCPDEMCAYSGRQLHYHCNWADCNYVVSSSHPVFRRLEHHKSHDYSTRKPPSAGACVVGMPRKRRGRPPKRINDYEFSEEEIRARAAVEGPSSPIAHGFARYSAADQCPDKRCVHRYREHFHCVRMRCHNVEIQPAAVVAHDRDFHANVRIAVGFEFFGADVDCRRAKCHARRGPFGPNGLRHFHCVRSQCDYAFVRQSTMELHDARHRAAEKQPVRIVPRPATMLPQISSPTILGEPPLLAGARATSLFTCRSLPAQIMPTTLTGVPSLLIARMPTPTSTVAARAVPMTPLSQPTVALSVPGSATVQGLASPTSIIVVASEAKSELASRPPSDARPAAAASTPSSDKTRRGTTNNCGWPSCQLKHVAHFHCCHCRDAYTDILGLSEHLTRVHGVAAAAGVQPPISLEPTNPSNNTPVNTTCPASVGSHTAVRQPASVCSQSASNDTNNANNITP